MKLGKYLLSHRCQAPGRLTWSKTCPCPSASSGSAKGAGVSSQMAENALREARGVVKGITRETSPGSAGLGTAGNRLGFGMGPRKQTDAGLGRWGGGRWARAWKCIQCYGLSSVPLSSSAEALAPGGLSTDSESPGEIARVETGVLAGKGRGTGDLPPCTHGGPGQRRPPPASRDQDPALPHVDLGHPASDVRKPISAVEATTCGGPSGSQCGGHRKPRAVRVDGPTG